MPSSYLLMYIYVTCYDTWNKPRPIKMSEKNPNRIVDCLEYIWNTREAQQAIYLHNLIYVVPPVDLPFNRSVIRARGKIEISSASPQKLMS